MPKLNGKTYAYTKKGKKKYKEALAKSNKKKVSVCASSIQIKDTRNFIIRPLAK